MLIELSKPLSEEHPISAKIRELGLQVDSTTDVFIIEIKWTEWIWWSLNISRGIIWLCEWLYPELKKYDRPMTIGGFTARFL